MKGYQELTVFVSYSWDSDNHRQKVMEFVNTLRSADIKVIYDDDMILGDRITEFMEKSICYSDIVLFLCTPQYKKKADERKGGVGYENTIITGELFYSQNERKFIPILFSGSWSESIPNWASGKLGMDLTNYDTYDSDVNILISILTNNNTAHKTALKSEGGLCAAFRTFRMLAEGVPIYARSEAEADFLRRQAAGLTSSAEDAFGF